MAIRSVQLFSSKNGKILFAIMMCLPRWEQIKSWATRGKGHSTRSASVDIELMEVKAAAGAA